MRLEGRKVIVVGLGLSGRAAARFCLDQGSHVLGVDQRAELTGLDELLTRPHFETRLGDDAVDATDDTLVVLSPGVDSKRADIAIARNQGAEVIGEVELALRHLPSERPFIGVTGTNGKSTTVSLIGQLIRQLDERVFVGGNFGRPLIEAVHSDDHFLVVELSSYQLETAPSLQPSVGIILNITPDHLARHGDIDSYAQIKARVLSQVPAQGLAIFDVDDPRCVEIARRVSARQAAFGESIPSGMIFGAQMREGQLELMVDGNAETYSLDGYSLLGTHNRRNLMAALLTCRFLGFPQARLQDAVSTLQSLPHRLEQVPTNDGRRWINDSKSTNIAATRVSLAAVEPPVVLLLGGQGKGESYRPFAQELGAGKRLRAVITFGEEAPSIEAAFQDTPVPVSRVGDLLGAVERAGTVAQRGDAIMLSPACASFDSFDNFAHRGQAFRSMVEEAWA